jgi:hypothetical protein
LVVLAHDRDDQIIPVSETRSLYAALQRHPGVHYTELRFRHLDPGGLPVLRLVRELGKFWSLMWRLFRRVEA